MILIMKILLHNEYKIINLWYPTYVYQFFLIFLIFTKIECWPVFKQDPTLVVPCDKNTQRDGTGRYKGTRGYKLLPQNPTIATKGNQNHESLCIVSFERKYNKTRIKSHALNFANFCVI